MGAFVHGRRGKLGRKSYSSVGESTDKGERYRPEEQRQGKGLHSQDA